MKHRLQAAKFAAYSTPEWPGATKPYKSLELRLLRAFVVFPHSLRKETEICEVLWQYS